VFYKVLEGIKVIEYGNLISAPFCAKILADLGAEVIKIEEPDCGDEARRREPFLNDIPGPERSGLFLYLNMNKLGVTLNLRTTTGRKIFAELLRDANILVENNPPKMTEELGLSYQHLKDINPGIIMTSITPFGQTGPYRNYKSCELLNAHMSGLAYLTPRDGAEDVNREPLKCGGRLGSFLAAISGVAGTLGALCNWRSTGLGQQVDVSEQEAVAQLHQFTEYYYVYGNQISSRADRVAFAPFHLLPCKDGYFCLQLVREQEWRSFLEVMGNPDWGEYEVFKDNASRVQNWDALRPLIIAWAMEYTMEEIYRSSQAKGVAVGPIYTADNILSSKHLAAREFFTEIQHSEVGKLKYPGVPYRFSGIPREEPTPAPLLGEDNEEIYCGRLGYAKQDLVKLREAGVI
jgi:CoA:oxalate CoA-transferase